MSWDDAQWLDTRLFLFGYVATSHQSPKIVTNELELITGTREDSDAGHMRNDERQYEFQRLFIQLRDTSTNKRYILSGFENIATSTGKEKDTKRRIQGADRVQIVLDSVHQINTQTRE